MEEKVLIPETDKLLIQKANNTTDYNVLLDLVKEAKTTHAKLYIEDRAEYLHHLEETHNKVL